MARKKMLARIGYDKKADMYKLLLSTDDGETWDFSVGCECQRSEHDKSDDEPMFIHISLIEEMKKAIACGFEIVY